MGCGDGSVGKSICSSSMNIKVYISIIHIKSWAWLHVLITIVLIGRDRHVPQSLMASQTLPTASCLLFWQETLISLGHGQ